MCFCSFLALLITNSSFGFNFYASASRTVSKKILCGQPYYFFIIAYIVVVAAGDYLLCAGAFHSHFALHFIVGWLSALLLSLGFAIFFYQCAPCQFWAVLWLCCCCYYFLFINFFLYNLLILLLLTSVLWFLSVFFL